MLSFGTHVALVGVINMRREGHLEMVVDRELRRDHQLKKARQPWRASGRKLTIAVTRPWAIKPLVSYRRQT